jgi:hypothetical protein
LEPPPEGAASESVVASAPAVPVTTSVAVTSAAEDDMAG